MSESEETRDEQEAGEQEKGDQQDEKRQKDDEQDEELSEREKAEKAKEAYESAKETMKDLEESDEPPTKLEDWPDDPSKYITYGGAEGDHSYAEGPETKLGPADVERRHDGTVLIEGEEVDNPDEHRAEPVPGGPTDPDAPILTGEQKKREKMERMYGEDAPISQAAKEADEKRSAGKGSGGDDEGDDDGKGDDGSDKD